MKTQHGFTIIELLVTITVFAVMATLAVPAFVGFAERNRVVTSANTFLNALMVARSEAIKRNATVTVCSSNAAGTVCNNDGLGQWETGWTVFVDNNGDNIIDANEAVILVSEGMPGGLTLREPGGVYGDFIDYSPTGETSPVGPGSIFNLCRSDGDVAQSRRIAISPAGRPVVQQTAAVCP